VIAPERAPANPIRRSSHPIRSLAVTIDYGMDLSIPITRSSSKSLVHPNLKLRYSSRPKQSEKWSVFKINKFRKNSPQFFELDYRTFSLLIKDSSHVPKRELTAENLIAVTRGKGAKADTHLTILFRNKREQCSKTYTFMSKIQLTTFIKRVNEHVIGISSKDVEKDTFVPAPLFTANVKLSAAQLDILDTISVNLRTLWLKNSSKDLFHAEFFPETKKKKKKSVFIKTHVRANSNLFCKSFEQAVKQNNGPPRQPVSARPTNTPTYLGGPKRIALHTAEDFLKAMKVLGWSLKKKKSSSLKVRCSVCVCVCVCVRVCECVCVSGVSVCVCVCVRSVCYLQVRVCV